MPGKEAETPTNYLAGQVVLGKTPNCGGDALLWLDHSIEEQNRLLANGGATLLHCTLIHWQNSMALHCTALRCTMLHRTALLNCRTAMHCTALHCISLNFTALHCTALHCTTMNCTVIHWQNSMALQDKDVIQPLLLYLFYLFPQTPPGILGEKGGYEHSV